MFTDANEKELLEEGYTIVRGVLTPEEANRGLDGLWEQLESLSLSVKRKDPETWKSAFWPDNIHGIFQGYGVGHFQALWDFRQNPKMVATWLEIFRRLWGLEQLQPSDLRCSFDGFCFQKDNTVARQPAKWVHTDQAPLVKGVASCADSPLHPGLRSVQGVLNLLPNGPEDGGLWLYPKSHLVHQQFFARNKIELDQDWFAFRKDDEEYLDQLKVDAWEYLPEYLRSTVARPFALKPVKVCAQPGDLMLFDSRVHHQAVWPQGKADSQKDATLRRAAAYVCMSPAAWQTPESKDVRRRALALLKTTSHCPHKPKLFPDVTGRFPNGQTRHLGVLPKLTPLGRSLAGLAPTESWPKGAQEKKSWETLETMTPKREAVRQKHFDTKKSLADAKKSGKSGKQVSKDAKSTTNQGETKTKKRSTPKEPTPRLLPKLTKRKQRRLV